MAAKAGVPVIRLDVPYHLPREVYPDRYKFYRWLKTVEYSQAKLSLKGYLLHLNRSDFSRSEMECHCGLSCRHYKLQAIYLKQRVLLCPVQILMGWQRLRMAGYPIAEDNFDWAKLLGLAKG